MFAEYGLQSCRDNFCNMWTSVAVLKDKFVMSFTILGTFELYDSAQLHQLLLVTFTGGGLMVDYPELI